VSSAEIASQAGRYVVVSKGSRQTPDT